MALSIQLFALMLSFSVVFAETTQRRLDYEALDQYNIETASTRSGSQRATPSRLASGAPRTGGSDPPANEAWNRVCTKYGLEEGPAFDPEQARMAAGADEIVAPQQKHGGCSIM